MTTLLNLGVIRRLTLLNVHPVLDEHALVVLPGGLNSFTEAKEPSVESRAYVYTDVKKNSDSINEAITDGLVMTETAHSQPVAPVCIT